jgi:hypothetical protein
MNLGAGRGPTLLGTGNLGATKLAHNGLLSAELSPRRTPRAQPKKPDDPPVRFRVNAAGRFTVIRMSPRKPEPEPEEETWPPKTHRVCTDITDLARLKELPPKHQCAHHRTEAGTFSQLGSWCLSAQGGSGSEAARTELELKALRELPPPLPPTISVLAFPPGTRRGTCRRPSASATPERARASRCPASTSARRSRRPA